MRSLRSYFVVLGLLFSAITAQAAADGITHKVVQKSKAPSSIEIDFKMPAYDLKSAGDGYTELTAPSLASMSEEGQPNILASGRIIAVPQGFKPVATVMSVRQRYVRNVLLQPNITKYRCQGTDVDAKNVIDKALYASKSKFPENIVSIDDLGWMQGTRLARVSINPFQQDFARRELMVLRNLKLRIDFIPDGKAKAEDRESSPTFLQLANHLVINPNMEVVNASWTATQQETYLVVVADALKNSIADFVAWKKQKGYNVEVVSYSEAGGSRERVAAYIKNLYEDSEKHLTYVLLVGNGTAIPPFTRGTSSGNAASDMPYTLVSGNDNVPDILIGRVVANNESEVGRILTRAVDYERSAQADDWYAKGTTIASNEGSRPTDAEYARGIRKSLTDHTYTDMDDFLQGRGNATATNIKNALAAGRSWLTYIGHGSGTSWGSTNGSFSNGTIDTLKNPGRLPVIVDVACMNGSFVRLSRCLGKAWVTHQVDGMNAGAVGYYGASVNTSWHPPAIMATGIAKYHFERKIPALGGSLLAGQLYLIERSGMSSSTLDNIEWYNLFGDPSMFMRTAAPKSYVVKSLLETDNDGPVSKFVVQDHEGKGIPDMYVSVTSETDYAYLGGGVTDSDGVVYVRGSEALTQQPYLVTVTGYNYQSVQVGSSALR